MRAPEFWTSHSRGAKFLAALLSPLGALYSMGARLSKTSNPFRPRAGVLCVGNLTAGGTGKTPVALALARMLGGRGQKVVFLTRGYGGTIAGPVQVDAQRHTASEVGDEPLLLARAAPTIVVRDRAAGAALADTLGADIIILDDGHQNFSIEKDVSLVVVDAETGFGNGHVIPAGPLRESVSEGLARADAIILMGEGTPSLPAFGKPIIHASLQPIETDALAGKNVFAFAGIGRPEKFFHTLRALGANVAGTRAFADHHVYSPAELAQLRAAAKEKTLLLVTTEKDFVRIAPAERVELTPVAVHAMFSQSSVIDVLLDRLVARSR